MYNPAIASSHLPVLEAMKDWPTLNHILEFGMGDYSTPILRDFVAGVELVSYESDRRWYDKMDMKFGRFPGHQLLFMSEAEALGNCLSGIAHDSDFDMAFVDGAAAEMRLPSAIVASQLCNLVVVHDTQDKLYAPIFQYFKALGWSEYTYKPQRSPHTTMFTSDPRFIYRLKDKL